MHYPPELGYLKIAAVQILHLRHLCRISLCLELYFEYS